MPLKLFYQTPVISEDTDAGGSFNFLAAGESGEFYTVRMGVEAGGRTPDVNGFQTFGGVRAVARYVKIEALPASGGAVVISEASRLVLRYEYLHLPKNCFVQVAPSPEGGSFRSQEIIIT